jgi:hypothetical protein
MTLLAGGAYVYFWWANPRVIRELRETVFGRLRPDAPGWAGTLVVIKLD